MLVDKKKPFGLCVLASAHVSTHPPFQENAPKIGKWELTVTGVSACLFSFDCCLSFSESFYISRFLTLTNTEIMKKD